MARRSRLDINRSAVDSITLGLADGMFDVARAIVRVAETRAPDAEPLGEGLVQHGAAIVWVSGKQVARTETDDGRTPKKPKSLRLKSQESSVVAIAGFAFPAAFQELGTVSQPARPFLTPSVREVLGGEAKVILSDAMERRLRGERSKNTVLIAQRKAAARARTP